MRSILLGLVLAFIATTATSAPIPRIDGPPLTLRDEFTWRSYRHFAAADGLPNQTVLALAQPGDGRIYAGTDRGLVRYDGVRWDSVATPEVAASQVWSLLADGEDALLVGTWSHGLFRFDLHDEQLTRVEHTALRAPIFDLVASGDGRYWAVGDGALMLCRDTSCSEYAPTRGLAVFRVRPARWRGRDVLWLGLDRGGVRRVDDPLSAHPSLSDFQLTRDDGLPNNSVRALEVWGGANDDDLWIGCGRGLARWDGEKLTVYGAANGFPVAMVFDFQVATSITGRDQMYAALRPGGLATFRPDGSWILQGIASGVPSNDVHSLLLSEVGSSRRALWLGTVDAGIARRDPGQFTLLDERFGLPSRYVHGIGETQFGDGTRSIWAGTVAGARRWRNGAWLDFMPEAYAGRIVHDVVGGDDGSLWVATERELLKIDADGRVHDFNADNSALPAIGVNELVRIGDGAEESIWIATGHGLARYRRDEGLVRVALPGASKDNDIVALAADAARGTVWVGLEHRVVRHDRDGFAVIDRPCLAGETIYDLLLQRTGEVRRIWLATRSGVVSFDPDAPADCRRLRLDDQLGIVGGVAIDQQQRVFAFGSRVALRFPHDATDADRANFERFDRSDGLAAAQLRPGRSLWLDVENRLYAATATGLAAFEPESGLAATQEPRLLLTAATRGDGQVLEANAAVPADLNAVAFEFRLLSYEREHRIRYRAVLEGLPADNRRWMSEPQRRYERLPAGSYRLVLHARDADGQQFGPLHFAFRVLAPWWQQTWAQALLALMLIALGLGFGRWRARATERRAQQLAHEVALRTRELADANAQLERASLTDPLTGLGNRRHFNLATEGEAERAQRRVAAHDARAHLLLLLIDIDHFKRVNDCHGHAAGDSVLVEVAKRIDACCRAGDIVARLGGEEFVLLLRDLDREDGAPMLQRCLASIAATPVQVGEQVLSITVSIGAVRFPDTLAGSDFDSALAVADDALYTAKQSGRDAACLIDRGGDHVSLAGRPARLFRRDRGREASPT